MRAGIEKNRVHQQIRVPHKIKLYAKTYALFAFVFGFGSVFPTVGCCVVTVVYIQTHLCFHKNNSYNSYRHYNYRHYNYIIHCSYITISNSYNTGQCIMQCNAHSKNNNTDLSTILYKFLLMQNSYIITIFMHNYI